MNTPTPREVEMPLLGRAMGYAAGLKDCHDCFADRAAIVLYDALTAVTEQRDRLAEALENCREDSIELLGERDWWQLENRGDYQQRYQTTRDNVTNADAALQSLNHNAEVLAPAGEKTQPKKSNV